MWANANHAWEAFVGFFGAEDVKGIVSSRRQFGVHLLPDLQAAILTLVTPHAPVLLGVHQPYDHRPLTISALLVRSGDAVVALTPLQYRDVDVGETDPFPALNTGLWLFRVAD